MTTLSIRIEEKTKIATRKTLAHLGIDLSSAMNMFLNQGVIEQGIPFKSSRISTKEEQEKVRSGWNKQVIPFLINLYTLSTQKHYFL